MRQILAEDCVEAAQKQPTPLETHVAAGLDAPTLPSTAPLAETGVAVSIVVPTRNEQGNIDLLASRLRSAMVETAVWELVVVDDSTDDTPEIFQSLIEDGFPGHLVHRPPEQQVGGLGGAVITGLSAAQGHVVVVMDGDLQHPPEYVPLLASIVSMGAADVAIASRYTVGGTSRGLHSGFRRAVSQLSRQVARLAVPHAGRIRDPLSGFFALRSDVVAQGPTYSSGFKVLLDILALGSWKTAVEVPFELESRLTGDSKADVNEGIRFARQIRRLSRGPRG
jgi:dolichol-phosphate mannosyltransferase